MGQRKWVEIPCPNGCGGIGQKSGQLTRACIDCAKGMMQETFRQQMRREGPIYERTLYMSLAHLEAIAKGEGPAYDKWLAKMMAGVNKSLADVRRRLEALEQ